MTVTLVATIRLDLNPVANPPCVHAARKLAVSGCVGQREAGDEVVLGVQRQEEDREHRIDRTDRKERQHGVGECLLGAARSHRSFPPASRSTTPASTKINAARMTAIAQAYPTLL